MLRRVGSDRSLPYLSRMLLDEELTDLITAQRSYEASARLMTTIDEMLQTLMTTGLVGR